MQIVYSYIEKNPKPKSNHPWKQTEFIFPVVGGYETEKGFEMQQLIGTAFYIKNGYYVTAAHVIQKALLQHKAFVLGALNLEQEITRYAVEDFECHDDQDIAIIKSVKTDANTCLRWTDRPISPGADVITFGFPFGVDKTNIVHRVFKGYLNAHGKFSRFGNNICYEVSFPCMSGLSGSFLLDEREYLIRGVVHGSSSHEIETGSYEEDEGASKFTITETMKLGLAFSTENMMDLHSKLLGSNLRSYLATNDLLR